MACKVIKIVVIFLLVLASCSRIVEGRRVKRVVGGSEVECDTQPRIGSLRNATSSEHLCGATLISQQFASTAAHCVRADTGYTLQLENFCEPKTTRVLEIILHELYDKYSRAHDIALLRLEPLDLHGLNETLLPKYNFGATGECTVYGYGVKNTSTNELSETLRAASMRIVPLDECTELLGPYVAPGYDSGMMCAVGNGVDTCEGDSGGPLICEGLVEGISSHGLSCGVPGMPAVYTSVRAHLAWIQQHVGRYTTAFDYVGDQY